MTDLNGPTYTSPADEALAHLRIAEGAQFDILNGRNVMDALEEQAVAIRMAITTLEGAI